MSTAPSPAAARFPFPVPFGWFCVGYPDEFVAALEQAGKRIELHRYDADHAFANPSNPHYDTKAAGDAWSHVHAFFDRTLR